MPARSLNEEMVASYQVEITGIERTKAEMAQLDRAIHQLRSGAYGTSKSGSQLTVSRAQNGSRSGDIFATEIDVVLNGRILPAVQRAMNSAMKQGKEIQASALEAAVTNTGLSGKPKRRKGPGRNVDGDMIAAIDTNVETQKSGSSVRVLGWHGWGIDNRGAGGKNSKYFEYQERGTLGRGGKVRFDDAHPAQKGGVRRNAIGKMPKRHDGLPAANSLGKSIIIVRENLKRELARIKK